MLSRQHQAILAKGSYENNDTARQMAKTIHENWDVDQEFSNRNVKVYHRPDTKQTVISFKGTSVTSPQDLVADGLFFFGLGRYSSRYKNAKKITNKVIEKYGAENVSSASHSLGANIGSEIASDTGIPTLSLNKGRTLVGRSAHSESSVRHIADPLSGRGAGLLPLPSGKSILRLSANPHSIDNFT